MVLFGSFLSPASSSSIQVEKKCVLWIFEKFKFLRKWEIPGVDSCPKPRLYILLPLQEKYNHFLTYFGYFWQETGQDQRPKSQLILPIYELAHFCNTVPGYLPVKKVWFQYFHVLRLYVPKVVFVKL